MNNLSTARQLFNHGDLPGAEELCLEILGLHPNNDEALTLLGDISLKKLETDKAEKFYRRAIEINSIAPWNYVGLAGVHRARGHISEAIEAYCSALQINPNLSWPNVCLGDLYLETGIPEKAIDFYEKSLNLEKHLILPKLGCGKALLQQNNREAAREYFAQVLQQDSNHIGALIGLGQCALLDENWTDAIAILEQAQQAAPDNKEVSNLLNNALAHEHGMHSAAHLQQEADTAYTSGNFDLAQLLYLQLLEISPEAAHPCCRLGEIALHAGQTDQALNYFTEGHRRQPDYPWAYVGIGDTHARTGVWANAANAYRRATELKPGNEYIASLAANAEAHLLQQQKELNDSVATADDAFQKGELELAASHYRNIINFSPSSVHAYCRLGEIALKQANTELAVAYYSQAVTLQPEYVWSHFGLGQALAAQLRFEESIKALQTAHRLQPDMAFIAEAISKTAFEKMLFDVNKALATNSISEVEETLKAALLASPVNEQLHPPVRALMELRGEELGSSATHQIELEMQRLFLEALNSVGTAP